MDKRFGKRHIRKTGSFIVEKSEYMEGLAVIVAMISLMASPTITSKSLEDLSYGTTENFGCHLYACCWVRNHG